MTVIEQLEKYVAQEFLGQPGEAIPTDLDLLNSAILDSLGMLKMIAWIETTFDAVISDQDLDPENFRSIGSIAEFVERAGSVRTVA
ncbi:acyl carrier protein [Flexivirga meconopsidis]|uniref:acyl carrier protein n=1 Tax=Flexivirga meconopsidis TaxID=2977121 RepID=UPI00223EBA4B|nr:acyl carrier protein [Flexivirga meconopsidis]